MSGAGFLRKANIIRKDERMALDQVLKSSNWPDNLDLGELSNYCYDVCH